jgi:hypothetical protein
LKNCGGNVTKREKLWLRVNLTRNHNTKQPLSREVKIENPLISKSKLGVLNFTFCFLKNIEKANIP